MVLDNASGDVLAWVGSSGELSRAAEVDGVLAQRQPGSTLKPLLYAQAIAERRLTAASLLDDSSAQISTGERPLHPAELRPPVQGPRLGAHRARRASLNVPAVRTLVMVSPDSFARQLRAVGAAAGAERRLLRLQPGAGQRGGVAAGLDECVSDAGERGAVRGDAVPAARVPPSQPSREREGATAGASTRARAFIVGDILSDANARARTFGLDSVLGTRFWSAVKTGTSKDMRDNWAIGWSQRYTVGVWVGNASGAPMWDVSGTSGAAPVWAELMGFLHRTRASRAPAPPPGLVRAQRALRRRARGRARRMVHRGHRAAAVRPSRRRRPNRRARITAPSDGTVIALDPDIPPRHQRVRFEAEGRGLQWRIDGKLFARGNSAQWLPWPGRHVVELVDARGQVVDQVRLEVRGAGVKRVAAK